MHLLFKWSPQLKASAPALATLYTRDGLANTWAASVPHQNGPGESGSEGIVGPNKRFMKGWERNS